LLRAIGASENINEDDDFTSKALIENTDAVEFNEDIQSQRYDGGMTSFEQINRSTFSTAGNETTIFGSQGQLLYQDIVDGDLTEHDEVLTSAFTRAKSSARLHLIQVKQRLISEKEAAIQNLERQFELQLQRKQDELDNALRQKEMAEATKDVLVHKYEVMADKVVNYAQRSRILYGSEHSVMRIFVAWKTFTLENRKNDQLNNLAAVMRRRMVLSRTFTRINRENQLCRLAREREENLRRVDQITKEVRNDSALNLIIACGQNQNTFPNLSTMMISSTLFLVCILKTLCV
jgi:hypothetical protein